MLVQPLMLGFFISIIPVFVVSFAVKFVIRFIKY